MSESRPSYCPSCGAPLKGDNEVVGIFDERSGDGGYDCYCEGCGWSGDVFPDAEQGIGPSEGKGAGQMITGLPTSAFVPDLDGPRTRRR